MPVEAECNKTIIRMRFPMPVLGREAAARLELWQSGVSPEESGMRHAQEQQQSSSLPQPSQVTNVEWHKWKVSPILEPGPGEKPRPRAPARASDPP